jgi:L-rhamnose mutarotase
MQRMGMMSHLRPEHVEAYKKGHADPWPSVLDQIGRSNIRNYSTFLREPENVLFAYFEYHGSDFAADMRAMADDPETQRWWAIMKPMHAPLETRAEGEWWAPMEEVFYVP